MLKIWLIQKNTIHLPLNVIQMIYEVWQQQQTGSPRLFV